MVVKEETTPGTFAAPATDEHVIRIHNIEFTPELTMDDEGSKYANGIHAEDQSILTTQAGTLTFEAKCISGATDATAPGFFTLAKMCGCDTIAFTTTGIGLVRRQAYDDNTFSCVIYDKELGGSSPVTTQYQFAGCIGNMTVSASINGVWMAKFTVKGKIIDFVDGSAVVLNAPGTRVAQNFLSTDCTIHSTASFVSEWEFDLGNEVQPVYASVDGTGISHYVITSSKPRFSANPLAVKQATTDWLSKLQTNTVPFGPVLIETAAAGRLSLRVIDAQPISLANAPREGMRSWAVTFKALGNGLPGSLIYTAGDITSEDTFMLLQGTTA